MQILQRDRRPSCNSTARSSICAPPALVAAAAAAAAAAGAAAGAGGAAGAAAGNPSNTHVRVAITLCQ